MSSGTPRRIAALYDIHGNLPALEAVLEEIEAAGVDLIVAGGDVVLGPMPRETLARLLDVDIPVQFIQGNCEREMLAALAGAPMSAPDAVRPILQWTGGQLSAEERALIARWPATCRVTSSGPGNVLFCHATPRNDTEIFTRLTPDERLVPIFSGLDTPLVVCGHTHMPFDRTIGRVRVVNSGSVGMPFGGPGADWLIIGSGVEPRHTAYDLARAAERIRASDYPEAEEFAATYVLQPPSEAAMLAAFSKTEL
jgi:predicted phosphodiesterase